MDNPSKTDINDIQITSLKHIIGQPRVISVLEMHLTSHFKTRYNTGQENKTIGPLLFSGPSGTGKTLVAKALHAELGNLTLIETHGEALNKKEEIYSVLLNADSNSTVFIDEAQGLNSKCQHILLTAISERKLYIAGKGAFQIGAQIPLESFTLILATTHEHRLQNALRNRMRIPCRFTFYTLEDLTAIVEQRVQALNWQFESKEILRDIAQRAKGVPRFALNRNLQICHDVAVSHDREIILQEDVKEAFCHLQIDPEGLDTDDRQYLQTLYEYGELQLSVISAKLGLEPRTLQSALEPYLIREGFITKLKSSKRSLTEKGIKHLEKLSPDFK